MIGLGEMVDTLADLYGTKTALSFGDTKTSFVTIHKNVSELDSAFRVFSLKPGDRIAILLLATPDFITAYFAAHRAGLVVMPLNPLLGQAELGHILEVMQPKLIISESPKVQLPAFGALPDLLHRFSPTTKLIFTAVTEDEAKSAYSSAIDLATFRKLGVKSAHPIIRAPEDEAVIMFSSGTSGHPKGISINEQTILANCEYSVQAMRYSTDDVVLSGLPFSHVFGQVVVMLAGLMAGATLRIAPRPLPDLLYADFKATKPTVLIGVPTTIAALADIGKSDQLSAREGARNLRVAATGGSSLPRAIGRAFADVFQREVMQGYGMTEVCGCISVANLDEPVGGDVGSVWPIFDWKIDPTDPEQENRGELFIRGPNVLRGYYIDGELKPRQQEDWFATGDVVELSDNRLTIVDRKKEMIIRGGYNIYPSEVEAVLVSHPSVSLAAVIGIPHNDLGEEIVAFVTLHGDQNPEPDALKQWMRDRIALYKYPRHVIVLDEMPTNPTGKILKKALPLEQLDNPAAEDAQGVSEFPSSVEARK